MSGAKKKGKEVDTEQSLLDAAIELYGQFGTQAVSLNRIRQHAAVANEAAIRYYFRNKEGLLSRSIERISERLLPMLVAGADQLESARPEQRTVRDVLMSFGLPFVEMSESDPNSLNFIGSLLREEGAFGHQLLARYFGETIVRYERLLAQGMPDKAPELVHLHFFLAINNLVHGLSDMRVLQHMPALSEEAKVLANRLDVLVGGFFDYVCAGVQAPPGAIEPAE